jgi:hypothetical protein
MKMFVARNHNGTFIAKGNDLGNLMEEIMFYEEVTGNLCTVNEEEFKVEPKRNIYA